MLDARFIQVSVNIPVVFVAEGVFFNFVLISLVVTLAEADF